MRDPLAPPVDEPAVPRRRAPKRKRLRMGAATAMAGGRAVVKPAAVATVISDLARRERAEKSKELLTGGRSKGEAKGYGVTSASNTKGA